MQEHFLNLSVGEKIFLAQRAQVATIRRLGTTEALPDRDRRGHPLVVADLGALLSQPASISDGHGICIELRRRSVLLCVDRVDEVDPALDAYCQPLPLVIRQHLRRTWVSGVVPAASKPILVLDLRQIALDVATCDPYCVSYGNKS